MSVDVTRAPTITHGRDLVPHCRATLQQVIQCWR